MPVPLLPPGGPPHEEDVNAQPRREYPDTPERRKLNKVYGYGLLTMLAILVFTTLAFYGLSMYTCRQIFTRYNNTAEQLKSPPITSKEICPDLKASFENQVAEFIALILALLTRFHL